MKKTILFFSLLLVGAMVMFGFQKAETTNINTNKEISIQKRSISDNISTFKMVNHNIAEDKCGAGKCGGSKAKRAKNSDSKCGAGKCGDGKTEGKKKNFMDKDTDGDGKVSMSEFKDAALSAFPKKDKNNDGKVTAEECPKFDDFNTDGNSFLSKDEFMKGHAKMFKKLDKNNDGYISASEAKDAHKCGDGKCGEGKCGAGKCGDGKTKKESKCGTGKCGG